MKRSTMLSVFVCLIPPVGNELLLASDTISLHPRSTFLHTRQDSALNAVSIALADLGIQPGDVIRLDALGDFDYGPGEDTGLNMIAVFSSSNVLLASNFLNRVPGAIDAGEDYFTQCTYSQCEPTNIPQDFGVAAANGSYSHVCVVVPQSATHLFVGATDAYYQDNSDPDGDYALRITQSNDPDGECCGPTNMLVNGGFESGDFSGWEITGSGSSALAATATDPQSGTFAAQWSPDDQDVEVWLSQSFVPMPSQRISELSFWARHDEAASSDPSGVLSLVYSDGTSDSTDLSVAETWVQFDFTALLDRQRELSSIEVYLVGPSSDVFLDEFVIAVGALEMTCPSDAMVACTETTDPTRDDLPITLGGCGAVELSFDDTVTPGDCPSAFTITRTWTAIDDAGNIVTCDQIIDVQDTLAPRVTAPARNRRVECDGSGNAEQFEAWLAENGGALAADACGEVTWSHEVVAELEGCAGPGSVDVIFTATDACGNASGSTASFVIVDNHAPRLSCPDQMVVRPTGPHGATVNFNVHVMDRCDHAPTLEFSPPSGVALGIGTTTPVACTATDACGNRAECRFVVHVQTLDEALESLVKAVNDLASSGALNRGQANALTKKLDAVTGRLANGRSRPACNSLQAFINQVTGFMANGVLTPDEGRPLLDAATDIHNAAGCRADPPHGDFGGRLRDETNADLVPAAPNDQCGAGAAVITALMLTLTLLPTTQRRRQP